MLPNIASQHSTILTTCAAELSTKTHKVHSLHFVLPAMKRYRMRGFRTLHFVHRCGGANAPPWSRTWSCWCGREGPPGTAVALLLCAGVISRTRVCLCLLCVCVRCGPPTARVVHWGHCDRRPEPPSLNSERGYHPRIARVAPSLPLGAMGSVCSKDPPSFDKDQRNWAQSQRVDDKINDERGKVSAHGSSRAPPNARRVADV